MSSQAPFPEENNPILELRNRQITAVHNISRELSKTLDLDELEIIGSLAATAIENAELARNSELAAVAHAVGDLSHDIKNKVTPISMSVETLAPMTESMYADIDRICGLLPDMHAQDLRSATGFLKNFYFETFQIIRDQVQDIQDYTKLIADALQGIIT